MLKQSTTAAVHRAAMAGTSLVRRSPLQARLARSYSQVVASTPSKPRIAIIGAGPAGLTLACLLHKRDIPFTVYELRPKPTEADLTLGQSGVLDLHPETGLAAIDACGLRGDFDARTVDCAEASVVADKDGVVLWSDTQGDGTRPEISRHALTKLLLSRLPDGCVRWGCKLLSAEAEDIQDNDGERAQYSLTFSSAAAAQQQQQGQKEQQKTQTTESPEVKPEEAKPEVVKADLLVGADGAWSRTRRLVTTTTTPQYSGEQMIIATIPDLDVRYPSLGAFVGKGSVIVAGDGNAIIGQRAAGGGAARLYFVITARDDEKLARTIGLDRMTDAEEVKELLLGEGRDNNMGQGHWRNFNTWGPLPKALLSAAIDEHFGLVPSQVEVPATSAAAQNHHRPIEMKPMYMLPVGKLAWPHRAGVTLVGDAAHLMTPFAGEGCNLAMRDALDLASAIGTAWDEATFNNHNKNSNNNDSKNNDSNNKEINTESFLKILDPLLQDFEKQMIERGETAAEETWANLQVFFGEDAARKIALSFQQ